MLTYDFIENGVPKSRVAYSGEGPDEEIAMSMRGQN
jgi:hypothetical protein